MEFKDYIRKEYLNRREKNPAYSLRAFAQSLDVDQSLLSKILKGNRAASKTFVLQACQKLGLNPQIVKKILQQGLGKTKKSPQTYNELEIEAYQLFSHWEHFAILELMKTKDFRSDTSWVADRLKLKSIQVEDALTRLKKFSLIKKVNGQWQLQSQNNNWTNLKATTEAKKYLQKKLLEKAQSAIDNTDFSLRENASLTVQCSPALLPEIKKKLEEFRSELDQYIDARGPHEEVYQLVLGFFPLTDTKKDNPL